MDTGMNENQQHERRLVARAQAGVRDAEPLASARQALARGLGLTLPGEEQAWRQYREAVMYGYYMWGITRRVDPPIREMFTDRLGRAVMRHESFELLGVT